MKQVVIGLAEFDELVAVPERFSVLAAPVVFAAVFVVLADSAFPLSPVDATHRTSSPYYSSISTD